MKRVAMLFLICALAGCATEEKTNAPAQQPQYRPISVDQVKVYETPPAKAKFVAAVSVNEPGGDQAAMDDALAKLKQEAANRGANGVVLPSAMLKAAGGHGEISLSVEAIRVPK
jgi:hypothetical protein